VCVAPLLSERALKQTPQTIIKQEEDDLQQMIHPPSFVIQMGSTWRSHIPKARGNRRSDTSTQTLGTPKRPKESRREGGAIVFEWVYMFTENLSVFVGDLCCSSSSFRNPSHNVSFPPSLSLSLSPTQNHSSVSVSH